MVMGCSWSKDGERIATCSKVCKEGKGRAGEIEIMKRTKGREGRKREKRKTRQGKAGKDNKDNKDNKDKKEEKDEEDSRSGSMTADLSV